MDILDLIGIIILFLFVVIGTIVFIVSNIATKKISKEFSKFMEEDEKRKGNEKI